MYIERTHYYAKPGMAEEVRKTRARACGVREALGLPRGTVLHKVDPDDDGPDVTWQCEFATVEEHEQDLSARADSPEFEAVRQHMRKCYDRFERHFEEAVDSGG
jgi:hypothetical protein